MELRIIITFSVRNTIMIDYYIHMCVISFFLSYIISILIQSRFRFLAFGVTKSFVVLITFLNTMLLVFCLEENPKPRELNILIGNKLKRKVSSETDNSEWFSISTLEMITPSLEHVFQFFIEVLILAVHSFSIFEAGITLYLGEKV